MKARPSISEDQIRKMYDKLKEMVSSSPTGYVTIPGAIANIPLLTPEIIRYLEKMRLVSRGPTGITISTAGFLNPDFAGLVAAISDKQDAFTNPEGLLAAQRPPHRRAPK